MSAAAAESVIILPEIRQRSWALAAIILIDVMALELSLLIGCLARQMLRPLFPIGLEPPQYQGLALGILALPIAFFWVGLYPGYGVSAVQRIRARISSTFAVFLLLLIWNYSLNDHQWSRGVLVLTLFFALLLTPLLESPLRKSLIRRGICGLPVVILGAGRTGTAVARTLRRELDLGFLPIGFLDDNSRLWGTAIDEVPVLGPLAAASAISRHAKLALVAMPGMGHAELSNLVQGLSFPNVIVIPDLFGVQSLWVTSRDLGGILGLELKRNLLIPSNRIVKRFLDYALSLPLFILSLPVLIACTLWVKAVSPGPALFRQVREGENGKSITVYKLRTMHTDSERVLREFLAADPQGRVAWTSSYKLKNDPRVIPGVGRFLRRYSLDELPQLWNVLRGDMSLVGPRPFPYYHLDHFSNTFRTLRSSVMPGVTGLWQVSDRGNSDLRLQEVDDTYYIRNWSLWLDLYILMRTIESVFTAKGAY
jgi:Undecaprenyl-phosphate galactose phosphotransferase WbaP